MLVALLVKVPSTVEVAAKEACRRPARPRRGARGDTAARAGRGREGAAAAIGRRRHCGHEPRRQAVQSRPLTASPLAVIVNVSVVVRQERLTGLNALRARPGEVTLALAPVA
jgi:hypothetical protein